jgi:membrane complex biogenesis BtpA family protein
MGFRGEGIIGVVHVPAMPGDPGCSSAVGFAAVQAAALADAEALVSGGVSGLIIENFGSSPFRKGTEGHRVEAHQAALLTLLGAACKARYGGLPVGVNCLRNDAITALGIAAAAGLDFVRVNVHTGAYVTDQGLIEGEAEASLRYRQRLRAEEVGIWADVLVKHATPLAPVSAKDATQDTLLRGRADAVIVTGAATGAPISRELLAEVRAAAGDGTVLLGSGVTPGSVETLLPLASGAIVGTWFKEGGRLAAPVDPARVRELVEAAKGRFWRRGAAASLGS